MLRYGLKLHFEPRLQEQICSFGLILENLKKIDANVRLQDKSARSVLERHLWYLSDETVGLAVSRLSQIEEKETLVAGLSRKATERNVRGDPTILKEGIRLGDFTTTRTLRLLNQLQVDHSFLSIPLGQCNDLESYQQGKHRVQQLRVVNNDTAERGVKLFQEFQSFNP